MTERLESPKATCLTAPAMGGVAIVQVVGHNAAALINPLLASKKPLNLAQLPPGELRLCRFCEGNETIDETLVSTRYNNQGEPVIDLSLHGGPRIVQRVMLALKKTGITILDATNTTDQRWHTQNIIEEEAISLLLQCKTRAVAAWLVAMKEWFTSKTKQMIADLQTGDTKSVRADLETLLNNTAKVKYLIEGVRVVLIGEPNVGKSTLANALSDREHAIVSDVPGTTRDYTEHPAAAEGLPLTIVDTAGVREAEDVLEQEAIRRTHKQLESADVIIQVLDASDAAAKPSAPALKQWSENKPQLKVWNKCDRMDSALGTPHSALLVSSLTGQGLAQLRIELLRILSLSHWPTLRACFTARQTLLCERALSALNQDQPGIAGQKLSELLTPVR